MTDLVQLLVDSLSQCLTGRDGESRKGTAADAPDSNGRETDQIHMQRTNHEIMGDSSVQAYSMPVGAMEDLFDDSVEPQRQARNCCSQLPVPVSISDDLREAGDVLANARRQASASSRRTKDFRTNLRHSIPASDAKRKNSIKKARSKSNKRKADIFRPLVTEEEDTRNFASRFIGNNFRSGSGATAAILCFASPIIDEDEAQCLSFRRSSPPMHADDDTITSTLYFDAKYEHVVQNQAPIPIYNEYAVPLNDTEEESIWKIYVSGSHKTIQSIHCTTHQSESVSLGTEHQCILDGMSSASTSANSETSECGIQRTDSQTCESKQSSKQSKNTTASSLSAAASVVFGSIPSPPLCNNRKRKGGLATISDCGKDNDQKLRSKSTLSTTALTPVCSSRSNASLSPLSAKTGDRMNKQEEFILERVDSFGQMEC